MKYRVSIIIPLLLFLFITGITEAIAQVEIKGTLCPEKFGAVGDGLHDDTEAIQTTLDLLDRMGGGTIYLGGGTYMVSSIKLGKKTSLIGCGNGATLIKQIKGTDADCVIVPSHSAALRISNLSIIGNDTNNGIIIETSRGGGENHPYLFTKDIKDNILQPYKWLTIDDICIYHFDTALNIEPHGFNINICNSTFSHNDIGVVMKCSDSSMYNCYITNNKKDGLYLANSNNKISNVKSIFNGIRDPMNSAAIKVIGSRCQIVNCETQDNYCKGFFVGGQYNLLSNCISNTDGYAKEPKGYDPSIAACGFKISGLFNTFSNCAVSNYLEKYGAVYHSPIIVDKSILYYYPEIYNDIKVLIAKDRLIFHEPLKNVQTLNSKGVIYHAQVESEDEGQYFVSTQKRSNIIKDITCQMSSLQMLADFKCSAEKGQIVVFEGRNKLIVSLENKALILKMDEKLLAELTMDDDALFNKDDLRLIVSFSQSGMKRFVSLLCYEKTKQRGWIKKEIKKELVVPYSVMNKTKVRIGDAGILVKRIALSNTPLPESVFLPYSNTNRIYDGSIVYVDADSTW